MYTEEENIRPDDQKNINNRDKCLSQLKCCCWGKPCRAVCICCPPIYESTSTRTMYALGLLFGTLIMTLMMTPQIQKELSTNYKEYNDVCKFFAAGENCDLLVGYGAVYKIGFAFTCFFLVWIILTIGIKSSTSFRGRLHNGIWGVKIVMICGLVATVFVFSDVFSRRILPAWIFVSVLGANVFIIVQLLYIIQMSYSISDFIRSKIREQDHACLWKTGLILLGSSFELIFVACVYFMFQYFTTTNGCTLNKTLIAINTGLCLLVQLIAVQPYLRTRTGSTFAGFMQSTLISIYTMYLTSTALFSRPGSTAPYLPDPLKLKPEDPVEFKVLTKDEEDEQCGVGGTNFEINELILPYIGVIIMFITVTYSCIGAAESGRTVGVNVEASKKTTVISILTCCCSKNTTSDPVDYKGGQPVILNERNGMTYSYWLFHFMFMLATMFITMQITNWMTLSPNWVKDDRGYDITHFNKSSTSAYIKLTSSWFCLLVYAVSLLLPECCPGKLDRRPRRIKDSSVDKDESVDIIELPDVSIA